MRRTVLECRRHCSMSTLASCIVWMVSRFKGPARSLLLPHEAAPAARGACDRVPGWASRLYFVRPNSARTSLDAGRTSASVHAHGPFCVRRHFVRCLIGSRRGSIWRPFREEACHESDGHGVIVVMQALVPDRPIWSRPVGTDDGDDRHFGAGRKASQVAGGERSAWSTQPASAGERTESGMITFWGTLRVDNYIVYGWKPVNSDSPIAQW